MDGAGTSSRRPGWTRRHPSSSAPLALERAASVMPEAERWRCWALGLASGAFGWGRGGLGVASRAFGWGSGAFGLASGTFGWGLTTFGAGWPALGGGPGAFGVEWRALGGGSRGFGLGRRTRGGGPGGLGEAWRARGVAWRERGERRGADGGGPGASQRGGAPPLRSLAGEHHGSSRAGDGGGGEDQGRVGVTDPPLGSRSDRKCGPSTATRRLQPRGDATSRADVPSRSGNEADGAASAAGRREHFRSDLQPPGCNPPWSGPPRSATKNEVKPRKHLLEMPLLHFADALREHVLVDCHDLRNVRDRVLRESSGLRLEPDIAWRLAPLEVARQRNADRRRDPALVQRIALHHQHRATTPGLRPGRFRQVGPPHFALRDHQSTFSRARRAARLRGSSGSEPSSSTTRFMASVT
jgi:hypothetical protein